MKPNFSHFLGVTLMLLTLVVLSANAQEELPTNEIPDLELFPELEEEKPLIAEPNITSEKVQQGREQFNGSSGKSNKSLKAAENLKNPITRPEEQDPLSFNFLYYIIQKFKISDIVEQ